MPWLMIIIVGFIVASTFLIKRVLNVKIAKDPEKAEKSLKHWSDIISVVGGMTTAISLIWAAYTYNESYQLQKSLAAANLYQEHMKLSIDHPQFDGSSVLAQKEPVTTLSSIEDQRDYAPYQWYVGNALFSFESILDVSDDPEWKNTFIGFICDHKKYLGSKSFPIERNSQQLQALIKDTLSDVNKNCKQP